MLIATAHRAVCCPATGRCAQGLASGLSAQSCPWSTPIANVPRTYQQVAAGGAGPCRVCASALASPAGPWRREQRSQRSQSDAHIQLYAQRCDGIHGVYTGTDLRGRMERMFARVTTGCVCVCVRTARSAEAECRRPGGRLAAMSTARCKKSSSSFFLAPRSCVMPRMAGVQSSRTTSTAVQYQYAQRGERAAAPRGGAS